MTKFHIMREIVIQETLEVEAKNMDDAISLAKLHEARLLTSTEQEAVIKTCWEKPTGISDPD